MLLQMTLFHSFFWWVVFYCGLPWWPSGKESTCQCRRHEFDLWVGKIPWRKKWQPTPVFLPDKCHGQRSLVGYHPWDLKRVKDSLATEQQQYLMYQKICLYLHILEFCHISIPVLIITFSLWFCNLQTWILKVIFKKLYSVALCMCVCLMVAWLRSESLIRDWSVPFLSRKWRSKSNHNPWLCFPTLGH